MASLNISTNDKMSSSILKPDKHLSQYPDIQFDSIEEIKVNTLDSYHYYTYNFLNIDVQGYELEALKGSAETLKYIDYIYCEVNRESLYENNAMVEDIDKFLLAFNFKRVDTDWFCGTWGEAFYIKENREFNWGSLPEIDIGTIQNDLFTKFGLDTENPDINFDLAYYYQSIGHTASAFSHYLRCAERTENKDLIYECFIRAYYCYESQGNRDYTSKHLLKQAIALLPKRPEAYYLLCKFYSSRKEWYETYTLSSIALEVCDFQPKPLRTFIGYNDTYDLIYEKAFSAWWWEKIDECKELLNCILENKKDNLDKNTLDHISATILNIEKQQQIYTIYDKSNYSNFKQKFQYLEDIEHNYSQCYQDMFVLAMTNGKRNGTYLEIGAGDPYSGNNTALLEKKFAWRGISVELDQNKVDYFKQHRSNPIVCSDATKINYVNLLDSLNLGYNIDYLQLDCEPPSITFEVLLSIPFNKYKFGIITYEHDYCVDITKSYRDKSRRYLESQGYELIVSNIAANKTSPFEDWWVHPDLIDRSVIDKMKDISEYTKQAKNYMLIQ
jgi:hypothetical protein